MAQPASLSVARVREGFPGRNRGEKGHAMVVGEFIIQRNRIHYLSNGAPWGCLDSMTWPREKLGVWVSDRSLSALE